MAAIFNTGLAISRALGDHCVKGYGLISVPHVTQRNITTRDQFVILASDGMHNHRLELSFDLNMRQCLKDQLWIVLQVWDVISNQEAVEIVSSIVHGLGKGSKKIGGICCSGMEI